MIQSETSAIWERGDVRKQDVFSIFTTLEGSKIHFLLLFGGSKSVISKRSVISNPRLASGFQENLSCKTQMNVCAPLCDLAYGTEADLFSIIDLENCV